MLLRSNIPVHPIPFGMGDTTFNKSPLAAQKKSHVFSKWPFPFITYWVSTRLSKIGHLRVILNCPRELDGPLLSWLKGGGEQLLREGNGISLHLKVQLGSKPLCRQLESLMSGHKHMPPSLPPSYFTRQYCLYSICLWVDKDKEGNCGAFEGNHSPRSQSIGRIMRRTDLRE